MKNIQKIIKIFFLLLLVACTENDLRDVSFVNDIAAPANVAAVYNITQDNTGSVTITPNADGAVSFEIFFGDGTTAPAIVPQGESAYHVYREGTFDVKIVAINLTGVKTEVTQQLIVSFKAPQNLVVVIENDAAISKRVNITANADFATFFEFSSGETGVTQPVVSGNIGTTISYTYQNAGTYNIVVEAKGGAIATTKYEASFVVTEILAPTQNAPTPPNRSAGDVISIFSDAYTNVTLSELPTTWSATNFEAITIGGNNLWKLTNLDFLGMVTNYTTGINVSSMETLHIDYWVPDGISNELLVKIVNTVDGGEDIESFGATVSGSWQSIDIDMSGFDGGNLANKEKITQILIDSDGTAGVVYIDNFYFYKASAASTFDDGLLTNGDFQNGSNSWIVGVDDNAPAPVVTLSGNTYYSVNVPNAGNAWEVNLSQKTEILDGTTYTLTFDAWSNVNRSIIAGIGLSGDPWSNDVKTVDINSSRTTYSVTVSANGWGAANARVLFDLGAQAGEVNIDNVSLFKGNGNLVQNGNFENGSSPWIIGVDDNAAAPVILTNGNNHYSVNVANAGNPWDVNLSQKLEIINGETYTLTFDAWSNVNRSMIAGIGLSGDPWSSKTETVNITTNRITYTYTITADFGAANARVLFDLGAAAGTVNIDNVSLSKN
ncbi:carbohydrate binding domain-containing protein [Polaribacter sp. BAL334]|uniref:carbohydrate binding domain-containing protein n=1 Tax=Polaribacter sp. BAL334 TaxID=1708178 RepID=UPI0018D25A8C|nr:carbohydrate binding domain-containing protein [Polaribacter sp. BAL334]MBG7613300.1 carbohydrate binding domain-containing protein [Polaribacter sp. BAL334]